MKDDTVPQKPAPNEVSAKRQKILADAFVQLRKSRSKVDPGVLTKIRQIVKNSPAIMRKIGFSHVPAENKKVDVDMPLSSKQAAPMPIKTEVPKTTFPTEKFLPKKDDVEKIDQARNMEVIAKLMRLQPHKIESIKAAIRKSVK